MNIIRLKENPKRLVNKIEEYVASLELASGNARHVAYPYLTAKLYLNIENPSWLRRVSRKDRRKIVETEIARYQYESGVQAGLEAIRKRFITQGVVLTSEQIQRLYQPLLQQYWENAKEIEEA